ncbi:MAG: hypothetical protein C5B60_06355 [Chloroflexi bacterium]|nr:MAG: hypothetical protein C5B60_06355 [Chloroflexota bacterium]
MDNLPSNLPPQQATLTPEKVADVPEMPSIAVALDLAREALTRQFAKADTLNTKAGFILGSASLLTGVLTAWRVPPADTVSALGLSVQGIRWLPLGAVTIYFFVALTSFLAYRLQSYSVAPDPRILRVVRSKIMWTWIAFGFLILEAVVTALILLVETTK